MTKKYLQILLFFVIGLVLTLFGIYGLFYKEPLVYIPIDGLFPYQGRVVNGIGPFILGLGFVIGGIIRWKNRYKTELKKKWVKRAKWPR